MSTVIPARIGRGEGGDEEQMGKVVVDAEMFIGRSKQRLTFKYCKILPSNFHFA